MYQLEIEEALADAVEHYLREMPEEIRTLINLANSDLYGGPVYLDAEGNECSCFDDGAKAFNFREAVAKISAYLDDIEDIKIETDFDPDTEESFFERVDGSAQEILHTIIGRELARYL